MSTKITSGELKRFRELRAKGIQCCDCDGLSDEDDGCDCTCHKVAAAMSEARKAALEEIALSHFRCKNCGRCLCCHTDKELKEISLTLAEYQQHIRSLAERASKGAGDRP